MILLEDGQTIGHYSNIRFLYAGAYAEIWIAEQSLESELVALKICPRLDEVGSRLIQEEYRKLSRLQHSNLVNVLAIGNHKGYPYMAMRYYDRGNASELIGSMPEKDIVRCMLHLSSALEYLHEKEIVHQDIKPNNILLNEENDYFLADLGLSIDLRLILKRFTQQKNDQIGSDSPGMTPAAYRAPESRGSSGSAPSDLKAVDIWALGTSLYEMVTGDPPFGDFGYIPAEKPKYPDHLPDQFSKELFDILLKCLSLIPKDRPTAGELKKWAQDFLERQKEISLTEVPDSQQKISLTGITDSQQKIGPGISYLPWDIKTPPKTEVGSSVTGSAPAQPPVKNFWGYWKLWSVPVLIVAYIAVRLLITGIHSNDQGTETYPSADSVSSPEFVRTDSTAAPIIDSASTALPDTVLKPEYIPSPVEPKYSILSKLPAGVVYRYDNYSSFIVEQDAQGNRQIDSRYESVKGETRTSGIVVSENNFYFDNPSSAHPGIPDTLIILRQKESASNGDHYTEISARSKSNRPYEIVIFSDQLNVVSYTDSKQILMQIFTPTPDFKFPYK